jgi:hypothetical protein
MLVFFYNIFKIFILFIRFLNFIYYYKVLALINNIKIYYLTLLYNYIIKFNNIFLLLLKLNNKKIKIFYTFKIFKLNFLYNLKKYAYGFKVRNFFDKFYILKLYNKTKKYSEYSKNYIYNKVIYKQFYIEKIFNNLKNNSLNNFFNIFKKKIKNLNNKKFFISFFFNKIIKKKKNKLKENLLFKNLFSLFFFNLLIYFFLIFIFIF